MENDNQPLLLVGKEKLSLKTKIAYGVGEFGLFATAIIQGFFLLDFLLEVAGVEAFHASAILLVAQVWEGIMDPIIGRASDYTKSRFGRRRSWILFGTIPLGITWWLLWQVPPFLEQYEIAKFFYYLAMAIAFGTAHTCVAVPYTALTADLSDDYVERTSLTMFRFIFGLFGGVILSTAHSFLVTLIPSDDPNYVYNEIRGYMLSASVTVWPICLPTLVTFFLVRERGVQPPKEETFKEAILSFFAGLKVSLTNRAYIILTVLFFFAWTVINSVQNNLLLYVKYVQKSEDHFTYLLLAIQGSAAFFLFIAQIFVTKFGKKATFFIGEGIMLCVLFTIYWLPARLLPVLYIYAVLAGIGVSVSMLIPWSMLPDVVDEDEWKTGNRREGDYYSIFLVFQKVGLGIATAASSLALGIAGYISPDEQGAPDADHQPESVILTLKLLVGFVPFVMLVISVATMYFYPITRQRHEEIVKDLKSRRRLEAERQEENQQEEQVYDSLMAD